MPQVYAPPALSGMQLLPPSTGAGVDRSALVPSPSWPLKFSPQQYAAPVVAIPQVCPAPGLRAWYRTVPTTGTGYTRDLREPSPSWPSSFLPQQYAAPSVTMPHEWMPPAETAWNLAGSGSSVSPPQAASRTTPTDKPASYHVFSLMASVSFGVSVGSAQD